MKRTGLDAMKRVAALTAGDFGSTFHSFYEGRKSDVERDDIAWNVLNWVGCTGLDSITVTVDGNVNMIVLSDEDNEQVTYLIYTKGI